MEARERSELEGLSVNRPSPRKLPARSLTGVATQQVEYSNFKDIEIDLFRLAIGSVRKNQWEEVRP